MHPIEITYVGFSRVGKGRDGNEEDLSRHSALTEYTTNTHFRVKEEKELKLEISKIRLRSLNC